MKLAFSKYQGNGNDFILVDDRSGFFPIDDNKLIEQLCFRNWGIGADGLILLQTSTLAHFRMRIFNSDGNEADICGNGLRCFILYLKKLGFKESRFLIETQQSIVPCSIEGSVVCVTFPAPKVLHWGVKIGEETPYEVFVVNVGVPHAVVFVEDLDEYPVHEVGRWIRSHLQFGSDGVNVNFVKIAVDGTLRIRTYERGVEGETLSCGSGSAAAALVASLISDMPPLIRVVTKFGGSLEFAISESVEGKKIEMRGPASFVFEGQIDI